MRISEISIDEPEQIPETLRERDQWVCWREEEQDGKPTKIPVTLGAGGFASATESETWASFEAALNYTETEHADGIGFVFITTKSRSSKRNSGQPSVINSANWGGSAGDVSQRGRRGWHSYSLHT